MGWLAGCLGCRTCSWLHLRTSPSYNRTYLTYRPTFRIKFRTGHSRTVLGQRLLALSMLRALWRRACCWLQLGAFEPWARVGLSRTQYKALVGNSALKTCPSSLSKARWGCCKPGKRSKPVRLDEECSRYFFSHFFLRKEGVSRLGPYAFCSSAPSDKSFAELHRHRKVLYVVSGEVCKKGQCPALCKPTHINLCPTSMTVAHCGGICRARTFLVLFVPDQHLPSLPTNFRRKRCFCILSRNPKLPPPPPPSLVVTPTATSTATREIAALFDERDLIQLIPRFPRHPEATCTRPLAVSRFRGELRRCLLSFFG